MNRSCDVTLSMFEKVHLLDHSYIVKAIHCYNGLEYFIQPKVRAFLNIFITEGVAVKAVNLNGVEVLLREFYDWHRTDHHNRQTAIRKAFLNSLKALVSTSTYIPRCILYSFYMGKNKLYGSFNFLHNYNVFQRDNVLILINFLSCKCLAPQNSENNTKMIK